MQFVFFFSINEHITSDKFKIIFRRKKKNSSTGSYLFRHAKPFLISCINNNDNNKNNNDNNNRNLLVDVIKSVIRMGQVFLPTDRHWRLAFVKRRIKKNIEMGTLTSDPTRSITTDIIRKIKR